jgi:zinc transport system permease protein
MNEFLDALWQHAFLQNALLAGLLASVGCGVVGSYVVVKRIGYLAGGISHSVLGGMGAAFFFGFNPLGGALGAALLAALAVGWFNLRWKENEDTLIGALWAVGMALGILFIAKTPGYSVNLMSYLFGDILMVPAESLWWMLGLDLVLLLLVGLFYRQFLAVAFDEEFARLRGVPVTLFYLLLLCMVAVTVVLLIQVVGLILVIALLTLPAAVAGQFVHTLGKMMLLGTLLGMLFTALGLVIAYVFDLPAGATIVLFAGSAYLLSTLGRGLRRRSA